MSLRPTPTQFVTDASDMGAVRIETLVYGPGAWHYEPNEWDRRE